MDFSFSICTMKINRSEKKFLNGELFLQPNSLWNPLEAGSSTSYGGMGAAVRMEEPESWEI